MCADVFLSVERDLLQDSWGVMARGEGFGLGNDLATGLSKQAAKRRAEQVAQEQRSKGLSVQIDVKDGPPLGGQSRGWP